MNKKELRQFFLLKRQKLSRLDEQSQAISQQFFHFFDLGKIKKVHVFLPILRQNEINTWLLIDEFRQNHPHVNIIISKSNFQTYRMESYILESHTQLIENNWGIPEPIDAKKCPDNTIDMILMPLLCFDKQGFRVGYGKGFYDRFLLQCKKNIIKIGLSLFEPVIKIDDIHENDVKMDYCVMTHCVFKTDN